MAEHTHIHQHTQISRHNLIVCYPFFLNWMQREREKRRWKKKHTLNRKSGSPNLERERERDHFFLPVCDSFRIISRFKQRLNWMRVIFQTKRKNVCEKEIVWGIRYHSGPKLLFSLRKCISNNNNNNTYTLEFSLASIIWIPFYHGIYSIWRFWSSKVFSFLLLLLYFQSFKKKKISIKYTKIMAMDETISSTQSVSYLFGFCFAVE